MITKHPWFGPKRIGWGWRPVNWEGWVITFLFVAVVVAACSAFGGSPMTIFVGVAAAAALVVVCLLTGTPPG